MNIKRECYGLQSRISVYGVHKHSDSQGSENITWRFRKSGSGLPLYKISVLLKTGGAGVFIITRKINIVIKAPFERFDR